MSKIFQVNYILKQPPEVFYKKAWNFIQKETQPCEFFKIWRTPFLQKTSGGCFWIFRSSQPITSAPLNSCSIKIRKTHKKIRVKASFKKKGGRRRHEIYEIFQNTFVTEHLSIAALISKSKTSYVKGIKFITLKEIYSKS